MSVHQKLDQAVEILAAVGMPKEQQNERSALCLLALLDLGPDDGWGNASDPFIGITPIMDWARDYYGKEYAPNSRETFRKSTMHQFVAAGISLYNPDNPLRPVNSPKAVYQAQGDFLQLVRTFGTNDWADTLAEYLKKNTGLAERYAREREQVKVPVQLKDGLPLLLSTGEHSLLIKAIIEEFGQRFAKGSDLVYVGDTGNKFGYFDQEMMASFGVTLDKHSKLPDVVLYDSDHDWLFLVESVTSVGPIDNKRYEELTYLFKTARPDLVYVTAFPDRVRMRKFLADIAWESEVWTADAPSHLIHFNGDKFVGPHKPSS
jgi:hypothetical protein